MTTDPAQREKVPSVFWTAGGGDAAGRYWNVLATNEGKDALENRIRVLRKEWREATDDIRYRQSVARCGKHAAQLYRKHFGDPALISDEAPAPEPEADTPSP